MTTLQQHPADATRRTRWGAGLLVLGFVGACLVSCANAENTTCAEWAAKSSSERSSVGRAMLRAHDLDTKDLGHLVGIEQNINNFCGILGLTGSSERSMSPSAVIENAIDFTAKKW